MSGPVTEVDATPVAAHDGPDPEPCFERYESRTTEVGGLPVRRALPKRQRRTIGAWCFVDHFGPASMASSPMQVGPHPHIGLQTVTWLVAGEVVHTDSLGSEQEIRPGQLNVMTSGRGVAHAEQSPTRGGGDLHGAQLWVALPEASRHGGAGFEHHAELPAIELGALHATVLAGQLGGSRSPASTHTPLLGAALAADRAAEGVLPLDPGFEHGVVVLDGALSICGRSVPPGELAYLGVGRDELPLATTGPVHALLLGGAPFGEELLMWWNFVARTRDEIDEAWRDWQEGADRFGAVRSPLDRIPAPPTRWAR